MKEYTPTGHSVSMTTTIEIQNLQQLEREKSEVTANEISRILGVRERFWNEAVEMIHTFMNIGKNEFHGMRLYL